MTTTQSDGLERLYGLGVASEMIPLQLESLKYILQRNPDKFPPRYAARAASNGSGAGQRYRVLTLSECAALRDMVVTIDAPDEYGITPGTKRVPHPTRWTRHLGVALVGPTMRREDLSPAPSKETAS
jgi:hypothetical protein